MVELVDTRDLKSLDRNIVPVQVRPRVPSLKYAKGAKSIIKFREISNINAAVNILNIQLFHFISEISRVLSKKLDINI